MKKIHTGRVVAAALSVALLGSVSVSAYALGKKNAQTASQEVSSQKTTAASSVSDLLSSATQGKTETVYVVAGANGEVQKVIVSDWIANTTGGSVTDQTDLENIETLRGDFSYTTSDDNMKVWDANGSDVYYKGTSDKDLPVGVSISYRLNGQPISAEELAGKSGRVTIRFDYSNSQYETVSINGVSQRIYVPFLMLSGLMLDEDSFTNVSVTNGKVINDGSRQVVIGAAMPGMQQNLGVSADTFNVPDYVEVTADTTDFQLSATLTLATNELANELDLSSLGDVDSISTSVEQLTAASQELLDGSTRLFAGTTELVGKLPTLIDGVNRLTAGVDRLAAGSDQVYQGVLDVNDGASTLHDNLTKLDAYTAGLNDGAKQVLTTMLASANKTLAQQGIAVTLTVDNCSDMIPVILGGLDQSAIKTMILAQSYDQVLQAVLAQMPAPLSGYQAYQYRAAVDAGSVDAQTQATVNAYVDAAADQTASAKLSEVTDSLNAIKSYHDVFYTGLLTYTGSVTALAAGSADLLDGTQKLSGGTATLHDGVYELKQSVGLLTSGAAELAAGANELNDGAQQLSEGMQQFYTQGISKLSALSSGDLSTLAARLRACVDVSKDYNSFAGIPDGMDGTVRFVYRTAAIEK